MAVIRFKTTPSENKPKKEFIDLSVSHQHHKKMHTSYKNKFLILSLMNLLMFLYIIFVS